MRLGIAFGLLALLLSLLISLIIGELARSHLATEQGADLADRAAQLLDALDRGMFERYREIQILAELDEMHSQATSAAAKRRVLEKLQSTFDYYAWIGLADAASGRGVVGTQGYLEEVDLTQRPWFGGGMKGPYVGDVHDALLLAKRLPNPRGAPIYLLDVAAPVRNAGGEVVQVLCGHLHWWWTQDVVSTFTTPPQAEVLLLSRDGLVLIGPAGSERNPVSHLIDGAIPEGRQGVMAGVWRDGRAYLSGFARSQGYRDYPGLGWTILIRQPQDAAFALAQAARTRILWIGVIAGLGSALLGWAVAGRLAAPITALSDAADTIGQGRFDTVIPVSGEYREVATLADSLRGMTAALVDEIAVRRAAEARLRLAAVVFEKSSEGILITDATTRVVLANPAFTTITGYAAEDIIGQTPRVLQSGRHDEAFYRQLWQSLIDNGSWHGEIWNRRKNGEIYPEWLVITAATDDTGAVVNYIAVFRDISDTRKSSEMIRKLQRAIEQSPAAVVITDIKGTIEYVNPQFTVNTGYTYAEAVGNNPRILKSGDKSDEEYRNMWQVLSSGGTWHGEFCNRRKDDSLYWEDAVIAPIKLPDGTITHYVAIKEDITARKKVEAEQQRSLDLITRQNAELERFAYIAAHDLQEPLRGVVTFSQIIERSLADRLRDEEREWMGFLTAGAQRMHNLIRDLLAYSSSVAASRPFEPVAMAEVCAGCLDGFRHVIEDSGATIELGALPVVNGDRSQLTQVCRQLLDNALKFRSPLRPPHIRISASRHAQEWVFAIADNGIGIERSDQDVFEIFRRHHAANAYPGTGVGLAICKRIVMHHGGRIWYESAPGQDGATLLFTLPAPPDGPGVATPFEPDTLYALGDRSL